MDIASATRCRTSGLFEASKEMSASNEKKENTQIQNKDTKNKESTQNTSKKTKERERKQNTQNLYKRRRRILCTLGGVTHIDAHVLAHFLRQVAC
jgi:hypothetical protein